jgi:hypothetical protein
MADPEQAPRVAEVHALARRIEARARREKDKDLARAGVLLRVLLAVMSDGDQPPAEVVDLAARRLQRGGLH